jgi:hypothetical protein
MDDFKAGERHIFRTFWHGPRLTWITRLCLSSFLAKGHGVELFSYAPVANVPSGVIVRGAAEMLPCEQVFLYRGGHAEASAPSLHSNLFRYKLLRDLGGWWIDGDVLLLDGEIPAQRPVFAKEDWVEAKSVGPGREATSQGYGSAVMNFPAGAEIMVRAYAEAAEAVATNPAWGVIGPYLFARLVKELRLEHHALPECAIYALSYRDAPKFVKPEYREEIERRTSGAPFVHLFQHMLKLSGVAGALPPKDSFVGSRMGLLVGAS